MENFDNYEQLECISHDTNQKLTPLVSTSREQLNRDRDLDFRNFGNGEK